MRLNSHYKIEHPELDKALVPLADFDSKQTDSIHFKDSWVRISNLESIEAFREFTHRKKLKDQEKDPYANDNEIDHLIVISKDPNKSFLIRFDDVERLIQKKEMTKGFNTYDFFVPRSIWWRSFLLLTGE